MSENAISLNILSKAEKIAQHVLPLGAARIILPTGNVYPIVRVIKVVKNDVVSFDVHYKDGSSAQEITLNVNHLNAKSYNFVADLTKSNPQSTRNPDTYEIHPWVA